MGSERVTALVGGLVVVFGCFGFFVVTATLDPDTWVPVLVAICLGLLSLPIINAVSGRPRDRRLRRILLLGLLLKLLFTGGRYYAIETVYKGEADAARYHQAGGYLVENLREGEFSIKGSELTSFPAETRFVGYLTGLLYVVFGTSYFGGFLVFSWLSWLGMMGFFRAFQVTMPNAPPYLAAMLLFWFPGMLFWPSSTGKDAFMLFLIGMVTMGVAYLLSGRRPFVGIALIACAGLGIMQVRPHVLLIAGFAVAASSLASPKRNVGRRGGLIRIVVLILMVPILVSLIGRMDTVLGTTGGGTESIEERYLSTQERTQIGGSAFSASPVTSPADIPLALITVTLRPFVFEARNPQVMLSSLEGMLLLALAIAGGRWVWRIGPAMYRVPFGAFCGAYILAFVVAFSTISNAGILSRQRVQMLPLLLLLACMARELDRREHLARQAGETPEALVSSTDRPVRSMPISRPVPSAPSVAS